jgi:hypothetical protein
MRLPRIAQACIVAAALAPLVVLGTSASASAASWKAKADDARGDVFYAWGSTRADAAAHAVDACVRDSTYASTCDIDWVAQV